MSTEWLPLSEWQQLPETPGIYMIRHRETQKAYIGQSQNVRQRIASHRYAVSWHYFGRALRRHGLEAFEVRMLATGAPEDLGLLEQVAILQHGTLSPAGYNLSAGGLGPTGVTWSYERRQAQILARTGFRHRLDSIEKMREAARKNNGFKGKKHTAEAKAKMAAAAIALHTGRKRSAEARANISASLKGRAPTVLSAEAREVIRQKLTGRKNPGSSQPGQKNAMYGVRGGDHPSAKRPAVWRPDGLVPYQVFDSATEAATWAGVSVGAVSNWCTGIRGGRNGLLWCYV